MRTVDRSHRCLCFVGGNEMVMNTVSMFQPSTFGCVSPSQSCPKN